MAVHLDSITEAQERIDSGEAPSSLVHEIWHSNESYYGLSSSITVEDYQRGGYTSRYYSLRELASM